MRDSFVFFRSFYESIECLGEKSQLKLYKAIMKLNFNCCENVTELEQLCDEIETNLKQNRNVYGTFLALRPHIMKSMKASFNGRLGGAPEENKNAKKNKLKEEEKEEEKEIIKEEVEEEKKEEEISPASAAPKKEKKSPDFSKKGLSLVKPTQKEEEEPQTLLQRRKTKEGYKIFGKFRNVFLFDEDLKNFENLCMSKDLPPKLIDELSENIAQGKENRFVMSGEGHIARLQAYFRQYKRNPTYARGAPEGGKYVKKGLSQEFIDNLFSED